VYAQEEGNKRIPFGGTKKADWDNHHHCATFYFTSPRYRAQFQEEAVRLLPRTLSTVVGSSDDNPAEPQDDGGQWY